MSIRLYGDSTRVAIYEEAPGGGDPLDPNSSMNRPVIAPMSWLSNIKFHSDLNYYGIAAKNLNVVINHPGVAAAARYAGDNSGDVTGQVIVYGQGLTYNYNLITHNLGYVPKFFCVYDNKLVPQGVPVQVDGAGRVRFVTAYATTTEIRLFEIAWSSDASLSAATKTYQVIVFRNSAKNPALKMLDISPGSVIFGQGKFNFTEPHLRAYDVGDSPFAIALNRTAGIRNGTFRAYVPNGSYTDFGAGYNGNLVAPSYINLAAGI